jgi:hypothetical protein
MRLARHIDSMRFWSKKYREGVIVRGRALGLTAVAVTSSARQEQQVFSMLKKFLKPSRNGRIQAHRIPSFRKT